MVRRKQKTKFGFTIIELLIVIVIIAILVALVIPVLEQSKRKGRLIVCQNNARQSLVAMEMYVGDNETFPDTEFWWKSLAPYVFQGPQSWGKDGRIPLSHLWHC